MNTFDDLDYVNGFWLTPEDHLVISFPYEERLPLRLYHYIGSLNLIAVTLSEYEVFGIYRVPQSLVTSILKQFNLWKSK